MESVELGMVHQDIKRDGLCFLQCVLIVFNSLTAGSVGSMAHGIVARRGRLNVHAVSCSDSFRCLGS